MCQNQKLILLIIMFIIMFIIIFKSKSWIFQIVHLHIFKKFGFFWIFCVIYSKIYFTK